MAYLYATFGKPSFVGKQKAKIRAGAAGSPVKSDYRAVGRGR